MNCLDCKASPTKLCDYHRTSSNNLEDERDEEIEHLRARLIEADKELVRRWDVLEAAKAALKTYGVHLVECAALRRKEYNLCDCGLADAHRRLECVA